MGNIKEVVQRIVKQGAFIAKHSGVKAVDDKGNKTRKHLSLLIWGHNPKKQ